MGENRQLCTECLDNHQQSRFFKQKFITCRLTILVINTDYSRFKILQQFEKTYFFPYKFEIKQILDEDLTIKYVLPHLVH